MNIRKHSSLLAIFVFLCCADSGFAVAAPPITESLGDLRLAERLSPSEVRQIGQRIWQNEGAGKIENLTVWNPGEAFPSFGIGHFIWFPTGVDAPFVESFPAMIRYIGERHSLPRWLQSDGSAPWPNRDSFYADINNQRLSELRELLQQTIVEQTQFILRRFEASVPRLVAAAKNPQRRQHIEQQLSRVAQSQNGMYALIDYVNFKGDGLNPKERYRGEGWGLFQVLESMDAEVTDPLAEFSRAADAVLTRRVANAERDESRWLPGWRARIKSYR